MWRAVVLIGLVAVMFVVVMFTAHDSGEPKPTGDSPPGYMLALGQLTTPFAPKLELGTLSITLGSGQDRPWSIPRSSERTRVATFTLERGQEVRLSYCPSGNDCTHDLPVCLIPERAPLPSGCRPSKNPGPKASVAAMSAGGALTLGVPATRPAAVVKVD